MPMTDEQRVNLEKLAIYLESLPVNYRHFRMSDWFVGRSLKKEAHYARENGGVPACGTVACAGGHGPAAGVLVPEKFIYKNGRCLYVDWLMYVRECFAHYGDEHMFMFGGNWASVDNHHHGAAARIRYVLAGGKVPRDFRYNWPEEKHLALYADYRIDVKAKADA